MYLNKTKRKNKNEKNKDPNQFLKRKTPVSKMKIVLELLIRHCREKKLVHLKTAIKTIQNETHREKNFFNKQHINELRDYIKQPYISVINFQKNRDKKVLIIVKIFPNLLKTINLQIHAAQ